jgi:hypothetical protein
MIQCFWCTCYYIHHCLTFICTDSSKHLKCPQYHYLPNHDQSVLYVFFIEELN